MESPTKKLNTTKRPEMRAAASECTPLYVSPDTLPQEFYASMGAFSDTLDRTRQRTPYICSSELPIDGEFKTYLDQKFPSKSVLFLAKKDADDKQDADGEIQCPDKYLFLYINGKEIASLHFGINRNVNTDPDDELPYSHLSNYTSMTVKNIHVIPEYQGQRIASVLMGYVLSTALGERCDIIFLDDDSDNSTHVTKNLYAKFGFKFIDEPSEKEINENGEEVYSHISGPEKYLLVENKQQIDAILKQNLDRRAGKRIRKTKNKSKRRKTKRR
jgi:GNAT superfamily N-acetyltransferase